MQPFATKQQSPRREREANRITRSDDS